MGVLVTELALARAKVLGQLRGQYPRWRIWHDGGWHAMRRGSFMQRRHRDAAAHSVHMPTAVLLRLHLAAEDAVECGGDWDPGPDSSARP